MIDYDDSSDWVHESNIPDLSHLKDHLQGVADAFYRTGDTQALENCLDECFHTLDMKLTPSVKPAVESSKTRDTMMYHIGYQRSQIDFMKKNDLTVDDYKNFTGEMSNG